MLYVSNDANAVSLCLQLPVLSMDISSDNTLIATGSADKNVKIWGLDFGDCHKSIFAHQESVTGVQFVHGTHYFFSISKDKVVKYWDGDKVCWYDLNVIGSLVLNVFILV